MCDFTEFFSKFTFCTLWREAQSIAQWNVNDFNEKNFEENDKMQKVQFISFEKKNIVFYVPSYYVERLFLSGFSSLQN